MRFAVLFLLACSPAEPETAPIEDAQAPTDKVVESAPVASGFILTEEGQQARDAMVSAIGACTEDESCMASISMDDTLLGNCPWYEAVGCSAAVAAAMASCVETEGELCIEALEAVKAIGCCGCLPKGKVQDACKQI